MDYTQLDIDHKRDLLSNLRVTSYAFTALEQISGCSKEDWIEEILRRVEEDIDDISDAQVERIIQKLEAERQDIQHNWEAIVRNEQA